MTLSTVKVTNVGDKPVTRFGVTVQPDESHVYEDVNRRSVLALRAVRAFEAEVLDAESDEPEVEDATEDVTDAGEPEGDDQSFDPAEHTIPDVLAAVEAGEVSVEEALEAEHEGKDRSTLIAALERLGE